MHKLLCIIVFVLFAFSRGLSLYCKRKNARISTRHECVLWANRPPGYGGGGCPHTQGRYAPPLRRGAAVGGALLLSIHVFGFIGFIHSCVEERTYKALTFGGGDPRPSSGALGSGSEPEVHGSNGTPSPRVPLRRRNRTIWNASRRIP